MTRNIRVWVGVFVFLASSLSVAQTKRVKEWAFLIFMNGHNNLSNFTDLNINQLETVGSTDDVDVIVQWAKSENEKTYRLKVIKDSDERVVTSPFVEELPRVDMGDYKKLLEFVQWSVEHYPAKRYFVSFWNHGSGWTRSRKAVTRGISYDDFSGNHITTEQMGISMREISKLIGHKVDIVGADACLMAMAEVAAEMQDSVEVYVASEELVPGLGWPYHKLIEGWVQNPQGSPAVIANILVEEYYKYLGKENVTMSGIDLTRFPAFLEAIKRFGEKLVQMPPTDLGKLVTLLSSAVSFPSADAVDIGHWLSLVKQTGMDSTEIESLHQSLKEVVVANKASGSLAKAEGISFWFPKNDSSLQRLLPAFRKLEYAKQTQWDQVLSKLVNLPVCSPHEGGQWASQVVSFSTQYGTSSNSASQVLGACNTKYYGDYNTAWAPKEKDLEEEYIEVAYENATYATGAIIRETLSGGFVKRVEVVDEAGLHTMVWEGTDVGTPGKIHDLEVSWPKTAYRVKGLKVTLNPSLTPNEWDEIDSIELIGTK